jgi:uncharacterized protein CbrC (UPF0167 family)
MSILHAVDSSNVLKRLTVDGNGKLNVTSSSSVIEDAVGTNGSTGPTKVMSIGGTESGGAVRELLVDADGHLQADVTTCGTITPGTAATNLGKAEDAAHTTGDVGVMSLAVRNDALAALATTDGDYSALQVNASGALYSVLAAGSAAIGTLAANSGVDIGDVDVTTCGTITPGTAATNLGKAEDAAHTTGDVGVMSLAVRNDALAALATTDGDYSALQVNAEGALYSVLAAGSAAIGTLAANSGVDIGDVDVTTCGTITPGTAATNLGKAEDAAHTTGDVGVMSLAVRNDALEALAGADGDYSALQVNAEGALYTASSTSTARVTLATGDGSSTAQELESSSIDLYKSNGKITLFGDFKMTDAGGVEGSISYTAASSTFNNIYLTGSHDNSAFFRMGAGFEITVDANGRFGTTVDLATRYIKICTINEISNASNTSLNIQYAYKS